jgi:hypothetical protein
VADAGGARQRIGLAAISPAQAASL